MEFIKSMEAKMKAQLQQQNLQQSADHETSISFLVI